MTLRHFPLLGLVSLGLGGELREVQLGLGGELRAQRLGRRVLELQLALSTALERSHVLLDGTLVRQRLVRQRLVRQWSDLTFNGWGRGRTRQDNVHPVHPVHPADGGGLDGGGLVGSERLPVERRARLRQLRLHGGQLLGELLSTARLGLGSP